MKIERVLLIDDEPDIRRIGQLSLGSVGRWKVTLATGGQQGVELAQREKPDLVLLDMMMPEMDGLMTLQKLRENPVTAGIPVIFMTAKVQPHEKDRYLAAGAHAVIQKPFDPLKLPDEIRKLTAALP